MFCSVRNNFKTIILNNQRPGPGWWSNGHCARFLHRRSEFEAPKSRNFYSEKSSLKKTTMSKKRPRLAKCFFKEKGFIYVEKLGPRLHYLGVATLKRNHLSKQYEHKQLSLNRKYSLIGTWLGCEPTIFQLNCETYVLTTQPITIIAHRNVWTSVTRC